MSVIAGPTRSASRREGPRVAIVTPTYPPSTGGVETYHQRMAERLAATCQVLVLTADLNLRSAPSPASSTSAPTPTTGLEVRYLRSIRFFGERLLPPWSLWNRLARYSPDVIVTSHPSLTGDLGGAFALLRGIPWVATYHGDLMVERLYARAFTWWEARLLRRTRTVLVHSEGYVRRLAERGMDARKVRAVTPGPGLKNESSDLGVERPGPREPGPDHPFLFVGGLDRARAYKRPELLLEAVARLRAEGLPVSAWFVGEGDRRAELELESTRLGLSGGGARFLGWLDDQHLAERYRQAWALVLPSTPSEGFGLVTIEALQFGCPSIVSSDVGAAPTLLRAGCAVAFDAHRTGSLDETMRSIWTDVARRTELARNARSAATLFGWDSALPQIEETILSAAGPGTSGGP